MRNRKDLEQWVRQYLPKNFFRLRANPWHKHERAFICAMIRALRLEPVDHMSDGNETDDTIPNSPAINR